MNTHDPDLDGSRPDDLDVRLAAALRHRAADVHLVPRGLGDVRRRVQRRRRRGATIGAAAVAVPALTGIAWAATRSPATTTTAGAGPDATSTTVAADGAAPYWRCTGPLGSDEQGSYFEACAQLDPRGVPVDGASTPQDPVSPTTTLLPTALTFPPMTTVDTNGHHTILVVDATGGTLGDALGPVATAEPSFPSPYRIELLVADRTSPETMVMPVADDDETTTNASVVAASLGISGFDTWNPTDWTSGEVPSEDDLAMVIVIGQDWPAHTGASVATPGTTPGATTTTETGLIIAAGMCIDGTYMIIEGDTPALVAAKLDTTVDDLALANAGNPDFDHFFVGAVINVPDPGCSEDVGPVAISVVPPATVP